MIKSYDTLAEIMSYIFIIIVNNKFHITIVNNNKFHIIILVGIKLQYIMEPSGQIDSKCVQGIHC